MGRVFVVDAGALLSNWVQKQHNAKLLTTSGVSDELKNRPSRQRTETLLSTGQLTIREPSEQAVDRVHEAAIKTGDRAVLSPNDIDVLALALEAKQTTPEVVLVSTDLALLNTARALGLLIEDPQSRMKQEITWAMRCPACGHKVKGIPRDPSCPICGTEMRRYPLKKKGLS
jgi:rRNA maturation endonuclease Nob1